MWMILQIFLKAIEIYSFVLVAYALLSWFPGAYDTSLGRLVKSMAEPVLKPLYRFNLQFLGLDWTVAVALFLCQLAARLLWFLFFLF